MSRNHHSKALFILFVGSVMQFGDFIVSRYFIPILAVNFCLLIYVLKIKVKVNKILYNLFNLHLIVFSLFLLLSFIGRGAIEEFAFDFVKLTLAFSVSYLIFYSVYCANEEAIYNSITVAFIFILLILILDAMFRFKDFNYDLFLINFYNYKINSLFFTDSNSLSLFALLNFSILYYYYFFYCNKRSLFFIITLILISLFIALSFSRASIVALLFLFVFGWYFNRAKKIKFIINTFAVIFTVLALQFFSLLMEIDESGESKIIIYTKFYELLWLQDLRGIFWGYGVNEGNYIYSYEKGMYSHALIPMVAGQFGLFGVFLYFSFFIYCSIITRGHSLFAFAPAFISGLSYLHPFLETIFVANAFILGLYFKHKHSNKLGLNPSPERVY
jgi:hypothetical protein